MLERKEITPASKPVFDRYIQNQINSTYNFTNMFMWSGEREITYVETGGRLALIFQFDRQPPAASYPVGPSRDAKEGKEAVAELCDYLRGQGARPVLRNLSGWMKEEAESLFPGKFEFIYDRNNADYVYETEKLISLSGKSLHAKRNHWNYFKNTFDFSYRRLRAEDMPACRELFDCWLSERQEVENVESSRAATYRFLKSFDELPAIGGGIWIDGRLVAASFAEPVSEDTVLAHLEFGDNTIRGVFNAINQQFCEHEWSGYRYINREEDMGLPGLRRAKLAYRPAFLVEKYAAVLKEESL